MRKPFFDHYDRWSMRYKTSQGEFLTLKLEMLKFRRNIFNRLSKIISKTGKR